MWRHLLIALVVLPVAAPAAGQAATVDFHPRIAVDPKVHDPSHFVVTGDDGADDLRLTWTGTGPGEALDVVDPTRPVILLAGSSTAGTRCAAVDEHHVRCATTGVGDVSVDSGGGDDCLTLSGAGDASVSGGAGDDVILTGDGHDQVDGGGGDDVLDAGSGNDQLTGGPGHDEQYGRAGDDRFLVVGDALGDGETLDGGSGRNMLDVRDRGRPLQVDLAVRRITSPRGVTGLVGFVDASAFALAPLVLGDDGPNDMQVGVGGRAEGRGGDDVLSTIGGNVGDAILDGGPGNDRLFAGGAVAGVLCGAGVDVVHDLGDAIRPADCEGAHTWYGFVGRAAPRGRAIAVALDAYDRFRASNAVCGVRLQALTTAGRPVTAAIRSRRRGLTTLRLPLEVAKVPEVVRLRVRHALACPRGGPPWTYELTDLVGWPAVTLTR